MTDPELQDATAALDLRIHEIRLRDEFAKAALSYTVTQYIDFKDVAREAYEIADAMIAERRKRQKEGQ